MSHPKIAAAVLGLISLLLAARRGFQLYSAPDPWEPYTVTVREFLGAGLRRDSVSLVRRSAAAQPRTWVEEAIRQRPAIVAGWAQQLRTVTGFRTGDTVTVALAAANVDGCAYLSSVTAQLLDHSRTPRLLAIASPCTRSDLSPLLPYQRLWQMHRSADTAPNSRLQVAGARRARLRPVLAPVADSGSWNSTCAGIPPAAEPQVVRRPRKLDRSAALLGS